MLEYVKILSPYLVFLFTVAMGYWAMKRIERRAISLIGEVVAFEKGQIKVDLEKWVNSEVAQKALYSLGGMIGSGAMAGSGLQPKGGKMKFPDLIMQLASTFIQGKLPNINPQQNILTPTAQSNTIPEAK